MFRFCTQSKKERRIVKADGSVEVVSDPEVARLSPSWLSLLCCGFFQNTPLTSVSANDKSTEPTSLSMTKCQ